MNTNYYAKSGLVVFATVLMIAAAILSLATSGSTIPVAGAVLVLAATVLRKMVPVVSVLGDRIEVRLAPLRGKSIVANEDLRGIEERENKATYLKTTRGDILLPFRALSDEDKRELRATIEKRIKK